MHKRTPAFILNNKQKQLHSYLAFPIQEPVVLQHQLIVKCSIAILLTSTLADRSATHALLR